MRLRCNGMCCLSLPELMVVSLMSSSVRVTSVDAAVNQLPASNPSELFALLSCLPAFDVDIFLTLQYLVSMGWRCCDGSKYGSHIVAYTRSRAHSMYCVTVSAAACAVNSLRTVPNFIIPCREGAAAASDAAGRNCGAARGRGIHEGVHAGARHRAEQQQQQQQQQRPLACSIML
jgi:hypothetical protein